MAMNANDGIRQRKAMAMGGEAAMGSGNIPMANPFAQKGVSMNSVADARKPPISDDMRGAGKPVKHTRGKLPSQADADHGPHR